MTMRMVACALTLAMAIAGCAQQGRLVVAVKGEQTLAIVDPAAGKVTATVAEGGVTGHEVTTSPDGRLAYVPIYGNSGVGAPGTDGTKMVVIDIASAKIVGDVDWGRGVRPHLPVFGPKDGMLYVTTELDKTITVIDPKTLNIVGSIPTGQPESHMLAIAHDGRRGYTANVGPGTVSVLDMTARKTLKVIPISGNTQRIAISMDDKWVFTADQTKPQMAVIDTATNTVARWVPMEGKGYGGAFTPDGRWFLITLPAQNKMGVIDLKTMQVVRSVPVGNFPQAIVVEPDGKTAYVSCMHSGMVDEVDLASWSVVKEIAIGKQADGMAWAGR
jgi:DNA-binding beta-propeller fold protein YncE